MRSRSGTSAGIVHNANAHDLHRKDCRCHRCSENCGESSTHTAHDHDMTVFFIEVKPASKLIADASAELELQHLHDRQIHRQSESGS